MLSDVPSIITAQFDLSENDAEKEHYDGDGPMVKLYPKNNKGNAIVYSGKLSSYFNWKILTLVFNWSRPNSRGRNAQILA